MAGQNSKPNVLPFWNTDLVIPDFGVLFDAPFLAPQKYPERFGNNG
jgi:hypothetical protein